MPRLTPNATPVLNVLCNPTYGPINGIRLFKKLSTNIEDVIDATNVMPADKQNNLFFMGT